MTVTTKSQDGGGFVDAVVVGAGLSGLYMLYRLKANGFSVQGFERGGDLGGTWYWNRYPGSRCDIPSLEYSYSFDETLEQEWNWTERFAIQPEIQHYLSHVADRFDLRALIAFNTSVKSLDWVDEKQRWRVHTDRGSVVEARFVVLATGPLSAAKAPDIAGVEDFHGEVHETSSWPEQDVRFAGKRIAVIGTGSSGIHVVPIIAREAARLTVFQRTLAFVVPARNRPLRPDDVAQTKANYPDVRKSLRESLFGGYANSTGREALATPEDERKAILEEAWQTGGPGIIAAFTDTFLSKDANEHVAEFIRGKIREIVRDPETAESLSPRNYAVGTKRLGIGTDYYETFNRDNVVLKDLWKAALRRIVSNGVETADGEVTEVDVLVLALGFDAVSRSFLRVNVRGAKGQSLAERWSAGPRTYLGLMAHGFPNLFFVAGPGSPSVLSNVVVSAEQHVEWIGDCLEAMRVEGLMTIEATVEAEDEWIAKGRALLAGTLFSSADSLYNGANVLGKPRVFMPFVGGVGTYRKICDNVAAAGYEGFLRSKSTS